MLGVVITSAIFGVLLWLCVRTHPAAVVLALPLAGPAGAWMATAAHGHSTREFVAIAGVALIFGLAELVATPGRWRIHRLGAALGIVGLMIVATEVLRGAL